MKTRESDDALTLRRLRTFLLALSAALYAGAMVELFLVEHTEDPAQLIPFGLCALGILSLAGCRLRPGRASVRALRLVGALVVVGSAIGMAFHLNANVEIARETMPGASGAALFIAGLSGGNPLFAPGILAVAAAIGWAATYSARRS